MANIGNPVREHEIELEPIVPRREPEPIEQPAKQPQREKEKELVPNG